MENERGTQRVARVGVEGFDRLIVLHRQHAGVGQVDVGGKVGLSR